MSVGLSLFAVHVDHTHLSLDLDIVRPLIGVAGQGY